MKNAGGAIIGGLIGAFMVPPTAYAYGWPIAIAGGLIIIALAVIGARELYELCRGARDA